ENPEPGRVEFATGKGLVICGLGQPLPGEHRGSDWRQRAERVPEDAAQEGGLGSFFRGTAGIELVSGTRGTGVSNTSDSHRSVRGGIVGGLLSLVPQDDPGQSKSLVSWL